MNSRNSTNDNFNASFKENNKLIRTTIQILPFPVRVTVMTLNVWGEELWPDRSSNLSQLLLSNKPDILLLQEVTPAIIAYIEKILIDHDCIRQEDNKGWILEGNIFYDKRYFKRIEYGSEQLNIQDYPMRSLFWVRLSVRINPSIVMFISTCHLPWSGCSTELSTGINQRIPACYRICELLRHLTRPNETTILGGDFNDDFHPIRILNEEMGLQDVFESLDLPPPITHPVRPSIPSEEMKPNKTLDWITCALPVDCKVIAAYVKSIRGGRYPPPSDHMPVIAVFEIAAPIQKFTEVEEDEEIIDIEIVDRRSL
mmetsp:Transcript_23737/g.21602  ORF Transcript_23737/g.21602 Transcript_23737/m.21602 type:complete len:313 (-) Transcript_23737:85-1023(-)